MKLLQPTAAQRNIFLLAGFLFLAMMPLRGLACIHSGGITGVYLPTRYGDAFKDGMPRVDEEEVRHYIESMRACQDSLTPECADVVVAYLYLKEIDEAYAWSAKLLKIYPTDYGVVINHALVLELRGQYREALKYLKQAIAIDPDAHNGSEWIHQRMLESRVAGKTKPKRSILGLNFGRDSIPVTPDSVILQTNLQEQLSEQIYAQLFFAKDKDPLLASLLFDYANLKFAHNPNLLDTYALAEEYGCTDPLLDKRLTKAIEISQSTDSQMAALQNQMNQQMGMQFKREPSSSWLLLRIGGAVISLVLLIVRITQKRNG